MTFETAHRPPLQIDGVETIIVGPNSNVVVEPAPENWHALGVSFGNLSIYDRTVDDAPFRETRQLLALAHGHRIVVGRQEGGETDYLDPAY